MVNCILITVQQWVAAFMRLYLGQKGASADDLLPPPNGLGATKERRVNAEAPRQDSGRNKFRAFSLPFCLCYPNGDEITTETQFESLAIRALHLKQNISERHSSYQPTTSLQGIRDSSEWGQSSSPVVEQTSLFTDTCSHYQEKQLSASTSA